MKKLLKAGCLSLLGIIVFLGVLSALFSTNTSTEQPIASGESNQIPSGSQNEPPEPTALPTLGQDVIVGDVRWRIVSVENLGNLLQHDNPYIADLTTQGTFIKVQFQIENLSNDMISYAGADLVDNQGRTFTSSADAFMFIPEAEQNIIVSNLNPNVPRTVTEIYEVPGEAAGLQFHAGDLELFGNDEAFIDLELN